MKAKFAEGVALIQILLITSILSVFALYVTQTAQQQLAVTNLAQQRAIAESVIHSAQAELNFTLLTEHKFLLGDQEVINPIANSWNFHGEPFRLNENVQAIIQDQAGLINLHYLNQTRFTLLLASVGIERSRIRFIIDRLLDWQDIDTISRPSGNEYLLDALGARNALLPDITEIEQVVELTDIEKEVIYKNCGLFIVGNFNPLVASKELISSLSSPEAANEIILLRKNKQLTPFLFKNITGIIEEEDMTFYPSNTLYIKLIAKVNQTTLTKEMVMSYSPNAKFNIPPFNRLFERS